MAGAAGCLLLGLGGGLVRLGWPVGPPWTEVVSRHGVLMVSGFLGTLIGLERAAAAGWGWSYAAPALSLSGVALALALPFPAQAGWLLAASALVLAATQILLLRHHLAIWSCTLVAGALCWAVGNLLWGWGASLQAATRWWMAFLVLTIGGERLEIGRVLRPGLRARGTYAAAAASVVGGAAAAWAAPAAGTALQGAGLVVLGLWLFVHDVARLSLRARGHKRYAAWTMTAGFAWLVAGGVVGLAAAFSPAGGRIPFDALIHPVLLGFVFSAVFAHGPAILPALLGLTAGRPRSESYWPYWVPVVLLHASLLLRIGGDLGGLAGAVRWGALLNAVSIVGFLAVTAASSLMAKSDSPSPGPDENSRPPRTPE